MHTAQAQLKVCHPSHPTISDDNLKPAEGSGLSAVICQNLRLQQGKRNGDPYGAVGGLITADEASALTLFMYVNDSVELNPRKINGSLLPCVVQDAP